MIIVNKNEGRKIDYAVYGTEIVFGNDELTLNLADIQDDWDIHVTVCYNKHHALTTGRGGITYVAEIDIPAKEYTETEPTEEGGTGERIPVELDMEKVKLSLWAIENNEMEE